MQKTLPQLRAVADATWQRILIELARMFGERGHTPNADDEGMRTAEDDDLYAWLDDLEARLGYDVDYALRSLLCEYCEDRAHADLVDAGYVCEDTETRDDSHVTVDGAIFDCFIDAAHTLRQSGVDLYVKRFDRACDMARDVVAPLLTQARIARHWHLDTQDPRGCPDGGAFLTNATVDGDTWADVGIYRTDYESDGGRPTWEVWNENDERENVTRDGGELDADKARAILSAILDRIDEVKA